MGDHNHLPPDLQSSLYSTVLAVFLAWVGRMAVHVGLVQMRRRKFWSPHLTWELMIAVAVGIAAEGLTEYLGLTGKVQAGAIVLVSYLGPRFFEGLFTVIAERYAGVDIHKED